MGLFLGPLLGLLALPPLLLCRVLVLQLVPQVLLLLDALLPGHLLVELEEKCSISFLGFLLKRQIAIPYLLLQLGLLFLPYLVGIWCSSLEGSLAQGVALGCLLKVLRSTGLRKCCLV